MGIPESIELAQRLAHLEGQIEGAIGTLRVGMVLIGGMLTLLIGSVVYTFKDLKTEIVILRKRTHHLADFFNRFGNRGKIDFKE